MAKERTTRQTRSSTQEQTAAAVLTKKKASKKNSKSKDGTEESDVQTHSHKRAPSETALKSGSNKRQRAGTVSVSGAGGQAAPTNPKISHTAHLPKHARHDYAPANINADETDVIATNNALRASGTIHREKATLPQNDGQPAENDYGLDVSAKHRKSKQRPRDNASDGHHNSSSSEDSSDKSSRNTSANETPSDSEEDDSDLEGDELENEDSGSRKGVRWERRNSEIPRWAEAKQVLIKERYTVVNENDGVDDVEDQDQVPPKKKKSKDNDASSDLKRSKSDSKMKHQSNDLNRDRSSGWPSYTNLIQETSKHLPLKDQAPEVRAVIKKFIVELHRSRFFANAFPLLPAKRKSHRKIVKTIARDLKFTAIADRAKKDDKYCQRLADTPENRVSHTYTAIKEAAAKNVKALYKLDAVNPTELAKDVAGLLDRNANYPFIFLMDGNTKTPIDGKPFLHPIFPIVLRESAGLEKVINELNIDTFTPEGSRNPQIPAPLLALTVTAVYASLREYATGKFTPAKFSADDFTNIYIDQIETLRIIRDNQDTSSLYPKLMEKIFTSAFGGEAASSTRELPQHSGGITLNLDD